MTLQWISSTDQIRRDSKAVLLDYGATAVEPVPSTTKTQWLAYSGQASDDGSGGIATFSNGDIATAFSVSNSNGTSSLIVQRLSASGAVVWSLDVGADYAPSAGSVLVDAGDKVYVSGGTKKGATGETGLNDSDVFAAAISTTGQKLWYKNYGLGV